MSKRLKKLGIEEADQEDIRYWKSKSPEEKLDAV